MAGDGYEPNKLRAAIMLHAACSSAADAFNDEDDVDGLYLAVEAETMRLLVADYLARAATHVNARLPGGHPA